MRINFTIPGTLAAVIVLAHTAFAQTAEEQPVVKPKFTYMNMFNSGALIGNSSAGAAFSFSTIHGVRKGDLAAGVGLGYDGYDRWKVVPLTASVSYDVAKIKNNAFFIQLNGGVAADAWRDTENLIGSPSYKFNDGRTFSPMAGYRISGGKFSMYVSAGYKYQRINYEFDNSMWYNLVDFAPGSSYMPPKYSVKETMERLVIQIGIGLH